MFRKRKQFLIIPFGYGAGHAVLLFPNCELDIGFLLQSIL